jgi:hypothetical protein
LSSYRLKAVVDELGSWSGICVVYLWDIRAFRIKCSDVVKVLCSVFIIIFSSSGSTWPQLKAAELLSAAVTCGYQTSLIDICIF